MTVPFAACRHPGCLRQVRGESAMADMWATLCSEHDGRHDHGCVCWCREPAPDHWGECATCRKLVPARAHIRHVAALVGKVIDRALEVTA